MEDMRELDFYNKVKNWDFSMINCKKEYLTNWDMYKILNEYATSESKILDLGTGGGEKVLEYYPKSKEIIATDFSVEMIESANKNLKLSNKNYITFKQMDNLHMTTEDNYFDIVTARHTCTDPVQIYKTLKSGGKLILRGVDKLDCWSLKLMFNRGQGYNDTKPISLIDYENIISAGFRHVELVPIHVREYFNTKDDLLALLLKTPIINDFENSDAKIEMEVLDKYIEENTYNKGILLIRRYYGIVAEKNVYQI